VDLQRHRPGTDAARPSGDVFEVTLVNDGTIGHSIDLHAGALAPDQPMRTVEPGRSLTFQFTATRGGIWMYHCSSMPTSGHIANGIFGVVIIDPPGLAAAADTLVQSAYNTMSAAVCLERGAGETPAG